jgi:glycosyltransferase involved in cell wall biosynthesis
MDLSIIIPAHNEEHRIGEKLTSYTSYFNRQKGLSYRILVVINASKDKTADIVKKYAQKQKTIHVLNLVKGGKGYAVMEGCKHECTRANYIGFVDADMATPPEAFYDLLRQVGGEGGAIASRWLPSSNVKTPQTLTRRCASRVFNSLVRILFHMPYADTQCGAKLFKREVITTIAHKVGNTRFAFDVELLYRIKKAGYTLKEVPTTWEDKAGSSVNVLKVSFEMFTGVLRLRIRESPFAFIIRGYDALPDRLKIHHYLL